MEGTSGCRRRRSLSEQLGPGGGEDHISALPDDLLLLVLARLPCAGVAARTGVLSPRWRGLWTGLRRIVLRDVPYHSLEAALARVPLPPPTVSLLEIRIPEPRRRVPKEQLVDRDRLESLLGAAARLDPEEFIFVFPSDLAHGRIFLDLPCFHRATSIDLDLYSSTDSHEDYPFIHHLPAGVEFPALETLSMSRCHADLDDLVSRRCPRLRTLRLTDVSFHRSVLSVNSQLLEELVVVTRCINRVNIVAPVLTQLAISIDTCEEYNFSISILAPMVEKVSWDCRFCLRQSCMFGLWRLLQLSLQAAERQGQPPTLQIHARISSTTFYNEVDSFMQAIEKRLIAAFSVLELNLKSKGHVYGAFVSQILESKRIRGAIQRLKVDIWRPVMEEQGCPPDCECEPTDWKSQTISLTALEEVEISGLGVKDHDLDLLKLILRSAPILKRMTMKLSQEASASVFGCIKLYNIFEAYSSVQFYIYLCTGLMGGSRNCPPI